MLTYIMGLLGYVKKKRCEERVRQHIYETLVYSERSGVYQFKYEKHMHDIIYKLADMANVEVTHRLDSRGQLHIDIDKDKKYVNSRNNIFNYRGFHKFSNLVRCAIFRKR